MADLFRRVGKMLVMRPMTIIPPSQGATAIYNRVTTHASGLLKMEREDLGTKGPQQSAECILYWYNILYGRRKHSFFLIEHPRGTRKRRLLYQPRPQVGSSTFLSSARVRVLEISLF